MEPDNANNVLLSCLEKNVTKQASAPAPAPSLSVDLGGLAQRLEVAFLTVRDETGFWESRDAQQLFDSVAGMNRLIARFAGRFSDAVRDAGGDSREVQGAIFEHPDFERLEMGE